MIRGRYFAALLALTASWASFTAYGQNQVSNSGATSLLNALNLGLPADHGYMVPEPIVAPAPVRPVTPVNHGYMVPAPAISSSASSTESTALSGLPADHDHGSMVPDLAPAPWFQRFLLPVPEACGSVDDWCPCHRPGLMANVDYLDWSARRSGMDFASFVSAAVPTALPAATQSLDFNQASGFRGGLGYCFGNGWNMAWTYTYFYSERTETVTSDPTAVGNPTLIATQSYLDSGSVVKVPMNSVEADGTLQINIQDFDAEWSSCLNDTVGFKAFGGFRWAKISQAFHMSYTYAAGNGTINLPNNMDAAGIRLGAEFQWRTTCGLLVFGRAAESVLVADFQTRQTEVAPVAAVDLDVSGGTTTVVPVFEAAVGLAYARGPWEFRAGYEMSDWFNLVQVNRPAQSLLIDGYFLSLSFSR